MKRATPIISVDEIEPCVLFWTSLGFTVTAEVPHDDKLGFVMLNSGRKAVPLMWSVVGEVFAIAVSGQSSSKFLIPFPFGRWKIVGHPTRPLKHKPLLCWLTKHFMGYVPICRASRVRNIL